MEKIFLKAKDEYVLDVNVWEVKNPKGVVQVIHGMEEHQGRYERLAKFLNKNGYIVVTSNLRGHGKTTDCLGYFRDRLGYKFLISDQMIIREYIDLNFKSLPVFLFAHSMGTIIARVLLQTQSNSYQKVVLSGYPCYQPLARIGVIFSHIIKKIKGAKYRSSFLENLSVGQFNKQIKNPKTKSDWICCNEETVNSYVNDKYCGVPFTCSAYNDLYHLIIEMHKKKNCKDINKNLPILLLSGEDDACVGKEKGRLKSLKDLNNFGFLHVSKIEYANMRHEILNEKNNEKVYEDIAKFYDLQD